MTPDQLSVFSQMLGLGTGQTGATNSNVGTGTGMVGAGATGAEGALSALGGFNPAATNNAAANIAGGVNYANSLDIPGAVRNAMLPAMQTARDVTNPGIEANAAGTGNINSSRTGIAQGLVDRGLSEQAGGLASDMFNNAFTTGAGLTSNTNTANNNSTLSAMEAALSGGTGMAATGSGVAGSGVTDTTNALNTALTGASGPQANTQLGLQNQLQQFQSATSSPFTALQNLMSIIGTQNWGGTQQGQSTTTSTPSAMSTIGGLMGAGGSLLGSSGGVLGGGSGMLGLLALSDRRMKKDIAQIGAMSDGTPIYRFRYIHENGPMQIGLMAQDVEKYNPDAVKEISGVKFVDYDKATQHLV